jgi:hypothetical protein
MRRALAAAAVILLCGVVTACARPIGDLGRAQRGVLHDEIMPAAGKIRAEISGEPVSAFNLTDEEREMRDRVWRFLVAPHAEDWFMDTAVEPQRTRLTAAADTHFKPERYYRWLRQTHFQSSRVRYRRLADDARADIDTAPTTFASICRVLEVDRQRSVATRELRGLASSEAAARRAENEIVISWFARALHYRYAAYNNALDHLLVETPHEEAVEADARIGELAVYVELADAGDFCSRRYRPGEHGGVAVPPRVLMPVRDEGVYKK